jgi:hypothetical protein
VDRREFCKLLASSAAAVAAGRATAADDDEGGYGAIAYDAKSGRSGYACRCESRDEAERLALKSLGAAAKVAVWGRNRWLALATTDGGGWGAEGREDLHEVMQAAKETCRRYTGDWGAVLTCVHASGGTDYELEFEDGHFTDAQSTFLTRAFILTRWRLASMQVLTRVNDVATQNLIDAKYMVDAKLPNDRRKYMLSGQQHHLHEHPHPGVRVLGYDEKSDYWAKAPVGRVLVPFEVAEPGDIRGTFEVHVNRHWLLAKGDGSSADAWAGVLAHELLHNLGHVHGKDEYGDHLQINAAQQLVRTRGKYQRRDPAPRFACDCRRDWR